MQRKTAGARTRKTRAKPEPDRVAFTHTDKVLFPESGITKGQVLDFYRAIAPRLIPHLADRPVTLERLPDGLTEGGPRFWQKNTPDYYPDWIPRIPLPAGGGKTVNYCLVNDVDTLLYLVNQGALTFHVWLSRVQDLDVPDYVLFDLDRSKATFADVVQIARTLHTILDERKVDSYPKTSGKSGLHVLVPWKSLSELGGNRALSRPPVLRGRVREGAASRERRRSKEPPPQPSPGVPGAGVKKSAGGSRGYDAARAWAMEIAEQLVRELPELATTERMKSERHGHVYVDVIQNARGHHVVPQYVLRATPGATVSTPLDWDEVNGKLNPAKFTMKAVLSRVAKQKRDPMAALLDRPARRSRTARRA